MIEKQKFDIDSCRATKNYSNGEIVYRLIWAVANPLLFRLSPRLLYRWRSFLLRCFGAKIGAAVRIHQTVHIRYPWLLKIDSNTSIGQNATVYNLGPIKIGSRSTVSQGVHLCAGTHDHRQVDFPLIRAAINIGDDTWVCADAFVGPSVTIGDQCIVGARAVVIKNVEDNSIVAGNPAKPIAKSSNATAPNIETI